MLQLAQTPEYKAKAAEADAAAEAKAAAEVKAAKAAMVRFSICVFDTCIISCVTCAPCVCRSRASATIPMGYSRVGTAGLSRWAAACLRMAAPKIKPSTEASGYRMVC